jgi:hypothetical protein
VAWSFLVNRVHFQPPRTLRPGSMREPPARSYSPTFTGTGHVEPAFPYNVAPILVSPQSAVLPTLRLPLLRASLPYLQPSIVHINNMRILPWTPLTLRSDIICARPGVLSSAADNSLSTVSQCIDFTKTSSVTVARSHHRLPNLARPSAASPMVCFHHRMRPIPPRVRCVASSDISCLLSQRWPLGTLCKDRASADKWHW